MSLNQNKHQQHMQQQQQHHHQQLRLQHHQQQQQQQWQQRHHQQQLYTHHQLHHTQQQQHHQQLQQQHQHRQQQLAHAHVAAAADMANMNMFAARGRAARGSVGVGGGGGGGGSGCLYENNIGLGGVGNVVAAGSSGGGSGSGFDLDLARHVAGAGGGGVGYVPHATSAALSGYGAGAGAGTGNGGCAFSQNSMMPLQNIKTEPLEQLLTPTIEMEELIIKSEPTDETYKINFVDETANTSNAYCMNFASQSRYPSHPAALQAKVEQMKDELPNTSQQKPLNFPRRKLQTERSDTLPICQRCKQVFFKKHSYTKHVALSVCDILEYDFKCVICPMSFMSQEELQTHEQLHRNNVYFCHKYCGKHFNTIEQCEMHEYMHHDYINFVCNVCAATFTTRELLCAHLPQHRHQPRFDCSVCRLWFHTAIELHQHRLAAPYFCGKYYNAAGQSMSSCGAFGGVSGTQSDYNLQDCRMGVMEVPTANNFNSYLHNRSYQHFMHNTRPHNNSSCSNNGGGGGSSSSSNSLDFHMPQIKTEIKIEHDIFGTADYNLAPPPQPPPPPPPPLPAPTTPTQRHFNDFINKAFGSTPHSLSFGGSSSNDFLESSNLHNSGNASAPAFSLLPTSTTTTIHRKRVMETGNDDAVCCVPKCGVCKSTSPTLQFFTFPTDEKYLHQWLHNLKMLPDPQTSYANYRICSLHFPKRCINRYSLCYWAVPTFNLGHDDVANLYQNREITNTFTTGENAQCSMPGCQSQRGESNCKFYNFPNDMKTRIKWCQNARLPLNTKEPRHFCSRHFEDRCFGKFRLKPWAVPTLHLGTPYGKIHDNPGVFYLEEKKCCLVHCRRTRSSDFNLSLYRFPRDEVLLQRWCYNLRLDPAVYRGKNHKICSAHFIKEALGLRKLTPGAVPTLNLGHNDTFNIYENELPAPPPPPPPPPASGGSKMYFHSSTMPTAKYGSHSNYKFSISSIASVTSLSSSSANNYDSIDVCFVPSCKRNRHTDNITLHTIPRRPEQMKKWCHNLKLDIDKLHKGVRICSAHFESYCIGGCMRPFAVPTLNLGHNDPNIYKNPDVIKKLNIRETCCVPLCKRNRDRDHANLHRFPANVEMLAKWCQNLRKPVPDGTKLFNDAICEVHFEDRCLRNKRLEKWAVPTVNLGHNEELMHQLPSEAEIAEFWSRPSAPNTGDEEGECCVETCHRDPKVDDIKLYRTPDDPEVLAKWAHNLQLDVTELPNLRICNLHFESHCIGKRLHSWAIPTLNLAHNVENLYENPDHLHLVRRERRSSRVSTEPVKSWMPRCCLPHCRKMRNIDQVQLFRFPILNRSMLAKWCHNLQLPLVGNAHRRLCSVHFEPHVLTKRCPMPMSVPTLELNTPPGYKIYQNPARLKLAKLRLERVCIVASCRRNRTDGVQLFRFPHNRPLLRKWCHNTRQKPADAIRAQYRVCSRHFEPHSFGARRLSPGAIPTLHLDVEVTEIYPNEAQRFAEMQCVVSGCESSKDMERVRLFKFPCDDEDLLWKWCNNLKMNPVDCQGVRICSRHFEPECVGPKMLYKWALPTLELGHADADIELVPVPKPEERYTEVFSKCCVPTCGKSRKYDDAQMNSFPKNLRLFRRWKHNLKLDYLDFKEREKYKICNDHFEPVCLGKIRLNFGAIPTINLGHDDVDDLYEVDPQQLQVSLFGKVKPLFERGTSKDSSKQDMETTSSADDETKCAHTACRATRALLRELYDLPKEEKLLALWHGHIKTESSVLSDDAKLCGLHYMSIYKATLENAHALAEQDDDLKQELDQLSATFELCRQSLPVLSAQCSIAGCNTNQQSTEHKLFPFPCDAALSAKWRVNADVTQEEQSRYLHKVCSRHFERCCFTQAQRLRPWAVPTLELHHTTSTELQQNAEPGTAERPLDLRCCVSNCGREKTDEEAVKLFRFPTDVMLRNKWLHNIQLEVADCALHRVCEQHFEPRCLVGGRLVAWAMPTLNLGHENIELDIHQNEPPVANTVTIGTDDDDDELPVVPHVKVKRSLDTIKCCVPSCRRSRLQHGVRLFEFPSSTIMLKKWCHNLQLSMQSVLQQQPRICHLHFHKRCIDGKQLRAWAKPTRHLGHTQAIYENPKNVPGVFLPKCCLPHCRQQRTLDNPLRTFGFPKDPTLQRKWYANLRMQPRACKARLCIDHFPPEAIGHRKLRAGAVPTLNLGHDKPLMYDNVHIKVVERVDEVVPSANDSYAFADADDELEFGDPAEDADADYYAENDSFGNEDEEEGSDGHVEHVDFVGNDDATDAYGDNDDSKDAEIDDDDVEMLVDDNSCNTPCDPLDFVECVQEQQEPEDATASFMFDSALQNYTSVCCLTHCDNERHLKQPLSTFGFPREPELLQKWCDNLKLRPKDCTGRICIAHFEQHMLNNGRLKPGAVPTLNLGHDGPIKHNILVQLNACDAAENEDDSNMESSNTETTRSTAHTSSSTSAASSTASAVAAAASHYADKLSHSVFRLCCLKHCRRKKMPPDLDSGQPPPHIRTFRFPPDDKLRRKWCENLRLGQDAVRSWRLCESHFEPHVMGKLKLHSGAVPTLDLGHNKPPMHYNSTKAPLTDEQAVAVKQAVVVKRPAAEIDQQLVTNKQFVANTQPAADQLHCCIETCRKTRERNHVRLFHFPKRNFQQRLKWLHNAKQDVPKKYTKNLSVLRICSDHFARQALVDGYPCAWSMPTLNLGHADEIFENPPKYVRDWGQENCCLKHCVNAKRSGNVQLFDFPKKGALLRQWAHNTQQDPYLAQRRNYKLCAMHFTSNCFDVNGELKDSALPTLNLGHDKLDIQMLDTAADEAKYSQNLCCIVKNCGRSLLVNGVKCFPFPSDADLLAKWCHNLQLKVEDAKNAHICNMHFESACVNKRELLPLAVPTLMLGHNNTELELHLNPEFPAKTQVPNSVTTQCCVTGCGKTIQHDGVKLHRFPRSYSLYSMWTYNLRLRQSTRVHKYFKVCSAHFESYCLFSCQRVKTGAVPTLQLGHTEPHIYHNKKALLESSHAIQPGQVASDAETCSVRDCSVAQYLNMELYALPADSELRQRWCDYLQLDATNGTARLCALHFTEVYEHVEQHAAARSSDTTAAAYDELNNNYASISNSARLQTLKCCVPGCDTKYSDGIELLRFPADSDVCAKWQHNIAVDFAANQRLLHRVCALHFESKCFGPKSLHRWALPTLRLPPGADRAIYENSTQEEMASYTSRNHKDAKMQTHSRRCCLPHCLKTTAEHSVKLYRFPQDEELQARWRRNLRSAKCKLESHFVCQRHFQRRCFRAGWKLKTWAMPTRNLACKYDMNKTASAKAQRSQTPKRKKARAFLLDRCCLPSCGRTPTVDGVRLFDFPGASEHWRLQMWCANTRISAAAASAAKICSVHFEAQTLGRTSCRAWAVPTLELGHLTCLYKNPKHLMAPDGDSQQRCAVSTCGNSPDNGVELFKYPTTTPLRLKWAQNCRHHVAQAVHCDFQICSEHFDADCFIGQRLHPSAVPTLQLGCDDDELPTHRGYGQTKNRHLLLRQCGVAHCTSNNQMDNVKLYKFPTDTELLEKWRHNLKMSTIASQLELICQKHFEADCIKANRLHRRAIPTVQLGHADTDDLWPNQLDIEKPTLVQHCCVSGCGKTKEEHGVHLSAFPKSLTTLRKWERNLKLCASREMRNSFKVCSEHFERYCYDNLGHLRPGAVPTLKLGHDDADIFLVNPEVVGHKWKRRQATHSPVMQTKTAQAKCCYAGCEELQRHQQVFELPKLEILRAKWSASLRKIAQANGEQEGPEHSDATELNDDESEQLLCGVHYKFVYDENAAALQELADISMNNNNAEIAECLEELRANYNAIVDVKCVRKIACAVSGCTSSSLTETSLYKFPYNRELQAKWCHNTQIRFDYFQREYCKVCALHFEPDCITVAKRLKSWAIPTLQLPPAVTDIYPNVKPEPMTATTEKCCIASCVSDDSVVPLFKFPKAVHLLRKWLHNTGVELGHEASARICALHFEQCCWEQSQLCAWAVPTLLLGHSRSHIYEIVAPGQVTLNNAAAALQDESNFTASASNLMVPLVKQEPSDLPTTNYNQSVDWVPRQVKAPYKPQPRHDTIRQCRIANCKSHSSQPGVMLHKFPLPAGLLRKWEHNTGVQVERTRPWRYRICSRHFEAECLGQRRLPHGTMPTLHLGPKRPAQIYENEFPNKRSKIKMERTVAAEAENHFTYEITEYNEACAVSGELANSEPSTLLCCAVPSCRSQFGAAGIQFYALPDVSRRRSIWLHNCGLDEGAAQQQILRVCSLHFTADCFIGARRLLKYNAEPTLLLDRAGSDMARQCCVTKCALSKQANTRFFGFPTKNTILNKWLRALNMTYAAARSAEYSICEWHFEARDLAEDWSTAVPTLHLNKPPQRLATDAAVTAIASAATSDERPCTTTSIQADGLVYNEIKSGAHKCCLVHCQKHMLKDNVKIHKFPYPPEIHEKWAHNLRIKYDARHPWRYLICSDHFEPQCISQSHNRLHRWAVPTLNLGPNPPAILFTNDEMSASIKNEFENHADADSMEYADEKELSLLQPRLDINENTDQQSLQSDSCSLLEIIYEEEDEELDAPRAVATTPTGNPTEIRSAKQRMCCLPHCQRKRCARVKLFRVPQDALLRQKWEHNLHMKFAMKLRNEQRICSMHFERHVIGLRCLLRDAVPTLNLGHSDSDIYGALQEETTVQPEEHKSAAAHLHCHVPGCQFVRSPLQLYKFPINEAYNKIWQDRTQIAYEAKRRAEIRVCSAHFEADCVSDQRLHRNAIPTLHLPAPAAAAADVPGTSDAQLQQAAVISCSVPNCQNSTAMESIKMFSKFPDDFELFTKWCFNLKIDPRKYVEGSYHICSEHFEPYCVGGHSLRLWAVPTLSLGHHSREIHYVERPAETEMKCALPHCGRRASKDSVELFSFPKGELYKTWCHILQIDDSLYRETNKKICSAHFTADCFSDDATLKPGARPSLLLGAKAAAAVQAQMLQPYRCKCIVRTCYEMKQLYRFPTKRNLCAKWCHNLKVDYHPKLHQNGNFKICHKHFEAYCLSGGHLHAEAIPTLQLGHSDANIYKNVLTAFGSSSTPSYDENSSLRTSVSTVYTPTMDMDACSNVLFKAEAVEDEEVDDEEERERQLVPHMPAVLNMNDEVGYADFAEQYVLPQCAFIAANDDEVIDVDAAHMQQQMMEHWQGDDEELLLTLD